MAKSGAATVEQYLAELPPERRAAITTVRKMVLTNLPRGYVERMNWGMISYEIPLEVFSRTHNKQPLGYIALAAQKNHNALYLMGCSEDSVQEARIRDAYRKAGRKLDMGKSCLRFRDVAELPLALLGEMVAETKPDDFIAIYENAHASPGGKPAAKTTR